MVMLLVNYQCSSCKGGVPSLSHTYLALYLDHKLIVKTDIYDKPTAKETGCRLDYHPNLCKCITNLELVPKNIFEIAFLNKCSVFRWSLGICLRATMNYSGLQICSTSTGHRLLYLWDRQFSGWLDSESIQCRFEANCHLKTGAMIISLFAGVLRMRMEAVQASPVWWLWQGKQCIPCKETRIWYNIM